MTIPTTCTRFEHTVPDPLDAAATKAGANALALLAEYRVKLGLANKRIAADRDCNADLRARFAAGK